MRINVCTAGTEVAAICRGSVTGERHAAIITVKQQQRPHWWQAQVDTKLAKCERWRRQPTQECIRARWTSSGCALRRSSRCRVRPIRTIRIEALRIHAYSTVPATLDGGQPHGLNAPSVDICKKGPQQYGGAQRQQP
jgi:hypothetical protein